MSRSRVVESLPMPEPVAVVGRSPGRSPDGDDAYLLRLCLDLKLDALLLALGAAASDPACLLGPLPLPEQPLTEQPLTDDSSAGSDPSIDRITSIGLPPLTAPDQGDMSGDPAAGQGEENETAPPAEPAWPRWLGEDIRMARILAQELLSHGGLLPPRMGDAATVPSAVAVVERLQAFHAELRTLLGEFSAQSRGTPLSDGFSLAMLRHCHRRLTELELARAEVAELAGTVTAAPGAGAGLPGEFLG